MQSSSRITSLCQCPRLVAHCFSISWIIIFLIARVRADNSHLSTILGETTGFQILPCCEHCRQWKEKENHATGVSYYTDKKEVNIIATYSDVSGNIRMGKVKMRDLSGSWVWENSIEGSHQQQKSSQVLEGSVQSSPRLHESAENSMGEHRFTQDRIQYHMSSMNPVKIKRLMMRRERRNLRAAELILQDKDSDSHVNAAAIKRSIGFGGPTIRGKYSIWRKEFENPKSDSSLKLLRDQIIMAKAYANIAKCKNESSLYNSLVTHLKESNLAIGEATSDAELHASVLDRAKAMGRILSVSKDRLYDCLTMERKLRLMLQSTEDTVNTQRKRSGFLIQVAAKTIPRTLHCLHVQLAVDYFLQGFNKKETPEKDRFDDPSLYHYAIFSDNVLATSVVVNSTVKNAKDPEKHVFHIVTDKLNFAAMRMWFLVNPPPKAIIQVQNIDDFKWLNSSYCSVLRQLESARMKEYYFKANNPATTLSFGSDSLKYRNPKYLSMLNHLRFYLPEVYPNLDKILFLDDDIVVQKDLTALWSIDLQGMVNGAVETCKESFHRLDKYLNFSNPIISSNFSPNACGWAFGMNIFNLKEWKKRNMTGVYHHWQDMNEDRTLWKLGTLPPGLITFYNLTHPLNRGWHALGLGYDPALNLTEIKNAAVIHYNGNYKPWLNLAVSKYNSYWSKYVMYGNPYLQLCDIREK